MKIKSKKPFFDPFLYWQTVSHDLKNPLAACRLFMELLHQQKSSASLSSKALNRLEEINSQIDLVSQTLNLITNPAPLVPSYPLASFLQDNIIHLASEIGTPVSLNPITTSPKVNLPQDYFKSALITLSKFLVSANTTQNVWIDLNSKPETSLTLSTIPTLDLNLAKLTLPRQTIYLYHATTFLNVCDVNLQLYRDQSGQLFWNLIFP
jgi:signal transduction histidine kinase